MWTTDGYAQIAKSARDKSNELLLHMGLAVFGVAILILLFLGWRESLVVLLAIPVTLGLTLLVFYLYGYTLSRGLYPIAKSPSSAQYEHPYPRRSR